MSSFLIKLFKKNNPVDKSITKYFTKVSSYLIERSPGELTVTHNSNIFIGYTGINGLFFENDDLIIICDGNILINKSNGGVIEHSPTNKQNVSEFIIKNWAEHKDKIINFLEGNFNLFIHDKSNTNSYLYRDKFGTKSIIYKENSDSLYISSESKFILPLVDEFSVNDIALKESIIFRWNAAELQLLENFKLVPPASYIHIDRNLNLERRKYWDFHFNPEPLSSTIEQHTQKVDAALKDFFCAYGLKNKYIGVFLSGGVDSSILAAIAKNECKSCIGFIGKLGNDDEEARRALKIANYLDIKCHIVPIDKQRLKSDFQKVTNRTGTLTRHQNNLVLIQIIQYAAKYVDTILQGDAPEMLFGLSDSQTISNYTKKRNVIEKYIPKIIQSSLSSLLSKFNNNLFFRLSRLLSSTVINYAMYLDSIEYKPETRRSIHHYVRDINRYLVDKLSPFTTMPEIDDALAVYQTYTFLQPSLLRYDTLSQPYGVNIMAPFLHHTVVDVAIKLPRKYRYTFDSKPVIRNLCDKYFPADVSRWKKLGFPVPWKQWLQEELDEVCEESLNCERVKKLLPEKFLSTIQKTRDPEGLWSIISLKICLDEYTKHQNDMVL